MYIQQFLTYLRCELNYSVHTVLSYGTDLKLLVGHLLPDIPKDADGDTPAFDPAHVTPDDIRAWIMQLTRSGQSTATVKRKLAAVRRFYTYLRKYHGIRVQPAADLNPGPRSRPLPGTVPGSQMQQVLISSDNDATNNPTFTDVRNDLILNLLYQTGMRAAELLALTDQRVDMARFELKVLGKRNKERTIPFGRDLAQRISHYMGMRGNLGLPAPATQAPQSRSRLRARPVRPFLVTQTGQPLKYRTLYDIIKRALAGTNVQRTSPHALRHTFATEMLKGGAELTTIQRILGHQSLETTQIYTHLSPKQIKESYLKAHPRAKNNKP